jgi:hypothetical protein
MRTVGLMVLLCLFDRVAHAQQLRLPGDQLTQDNCCN